MPHVEWTARRQDVIAALDRLATITISNTGDWPDLTNAIHWLIDDTFWDQHPPGDDIGLLLVDHTEADAISAVLHPMLALLDELGPNAPDAQYLSQPGWTHIARTAAKAREVLQHTASG